MKKIKEIFEENKIIIISCFITLFLSILLIGVIYYYTYNNIKEINEKIISMQTNNEKIDVLVTNLFKADSFEPIYEKYSKVAMGYNEEDDAKPEDMEEYYSKEEIKKYGCIAIEIEKVLKW